MSDKAPPIFALSALNGYAVIGTGDTIGAVKDSLFVDDRWKVRWWWLTWAAGCRGARC